MLTAATTRLHHVLTTTRLHRLATTTAQAQITHRLLDKSTNEVRHFGLFNDENAFSRGDDLRPS